MAILDFIFGIVALFVGAFVVIGVICTIYDSKEMEEENKKLKEDLEKARKRNSKRVGGKK